MAAGVLLIASALSPGGGWDDTPFEPLSAHEYILVVLSGAGSLLLLGGFVALRARHVGVFGGVGVAGFRLAFAGTLLYALLGPATTISLSLAGRPPTPTSAVVFGGLASLASLAAEFGVLLMGITVLRARVLPQPFRSLPLAIFVLGVLVPLLYLLVFREDLMLRGEPDTGILALLVWDAPDVLIGVGWALLGYALWSGTSEGD